MAETKTILTDETGKEIVSELQQINEGLSNLSGGWVGSYSRVLANNSPEKIAQAASAGLAPVLWNLGDTIDIELKNGETVTMRIIGFNHDGAGTITFQTVDCLETAYPMQGTSDSYTNAGGWADCDMRKTLNETIFDIIPDEWQAVIRTVEKKSNSGDSAELDAEIIATQDKLFLPSISEMWSHDGMEASGTSAVVSYLDVYDKEGTQYEWFKEMYGDTASNVSNDYNVKHYGKDGSACVYWLRSAYPGSSTTYLLVNTMGSSTRNYSACTTYGAAFCFCLGGI